MPLNNVNPEIIPLAAIQKTDAELAADDKVYLAGQFIVVKDEHGRRGIKIGDWDYKNQPESAGPKYTELDWFISPEQAGSGLLNIFPVDNASLLNPKYENIDGNTVITDDRLKGKANYFVSSTEMGMGPFRPSVLTYDGVNGKLTISNYQLSDGELIWIIIPQGLGADIDYSSLQADVKLLKAQFKWLLGPLLANGSMMFWGKPYALLEEQCPGWEEVPEMRGRVPKGHNPENEGEEIFETTGGHDEIMLVEEHIPEMDPANGEFNRFMRYTGKDTAATTDDLPGPSNTQPDLLNSQPLKKIGTPVADQEPIDLNDPYRIVGYIRPIATYTPPII